MTYFTQGVQAQTVSNFFLAFDKDLHIIPVLNKVNPLDEFNLFDS